MITRSAGTLLVVGLAVTSLGCNKIKSLAGGEGSLAILKDFEGEIGVMAKSAKADAKTVNVLLEVKGDKVRADVPEELAKENPMGRGAPAGKIYGILKGGEKKAFVVMEAQKQAIVFDLNKFAEKIKSSPPSLNGGPPGAPGGKEPPKVTKTGKTEKVAGFECENWDVVNPDGAKASVCVGNQGPSWFSLPLTGIATEHAWMAELLDGKHFPLRVVVFEKSGAEQGRMEVTKIEKKSVDAAKFEIPAGFQTMDLEQMMAQMMSGLGGMGMPPGPMGSGRPGMPRLPPGFKPPMGTPHR